MLDVSPGIWVFNEYNICASFSNMWCENNIILSTMNTADCSTGKTIRPPQNASFCL